jgi:tetratricopeptide (TPR) repeat protein
LALLADWQGQSEQAITHLREAAELAANLGLPEEQWQIQAALGRAYEARGQPAQARTLFGEAATIIQKLAEGIGDEALRTRYLAGPLIRQVLQQARGEVSQPDPSPALEGNSPVILSATKDLSAHRARPFARARG